jgi:hypothetical protein
MDTMLEILDFIRKYGGWGFALLVSVYFLKILLDEEKSSLLRAQAYRLIYRLTGRVDAEKKYISSDIAGRLNLARRRLHVGKNILPRAVDVQWVEGGAGTSHEIREGEFIVRLDPSSQQEKNIVLLATAIVNRTTLQGIRHSVEPPLQTAIDLNLVKALLSQVGNRAALDYFFSSEYVPATSKDELSRSWNGKIQTIDERGLFTRILLLELEDFAKRIYGLAPRLYMAGEVEGLVDFLYSLAARKPKQEIKLEYERAHIRIKVIFVARVDKLLKSIEPYVRRMPTSLQKGYFSVYVLAYDKEWLEELDPETHKQFETQVTELTGELEKATVATKDCDVEFSCIDLEGRRRKGRCLRYVAPST